MIRYRPRCKSLSLSVKGEESFNTKEELHQAIYDVWCKMFSYIGKTLEKHDIIIGEITGDSPLVGWVNVRPIYIMNYCIGFCGER